MPYAIRRNHGDCNGWAVVKTTDGRTMGCHDTQAKAKRQLTALRIAENQRGSGS